MTAPTILFQPPNHVGLGHVSRLLAIALAVKELDPAIRLPFAVEGSAHGLLEAYGLPYLALPHILSLYEGTEWRAWIRQTRRELAFEIASAIVRTLQPQLTVFDCFPNHGMFTAIVERQLPAVICLRKLKYMTPHIDMIRKNWRLFRAILVAHHEDECPLPDDIRAKARFIGPIMRPLPAHPSTHFAFAGGKSVVVSGGGGGFPGTVRFYNLALAALARVQDSIPAMDAVLITGPLFTEWRDLEPTRGVRILPFDPHLSATFAGADLVICQSGYNTMTELAAIGVPTITVPAERESDDQFARAARSASDTIQTYTGTDPSALAGVIIDTLGRPPVSRPLMQPLAGARLAAEVLIHSLRE